MGLPGKKLSRSSKRERASHFRLESVNAGSCPRCHQPVLPHRACANCGTYRGRTVLMVRSPLAKTAKAEQPTAAPAEHQHEAGAAAH